MRRPHGHKAPHTADAKGPLEWCLDGILVILTVAGFAMALAYVYHPCLI